MRLEAHIYPAIGDRYIRAVKTNDVTRLLEGIRDAGTINTAHRVHTLDQPRGLRLDSSLVHALIDPASAMSAATLGFEERLTLLVQREIDWRDGKRLNRLLKAAKLKVSGACIEDIDWRASRGLDRSLVTALAGGDWLRHGHNVLITGATGVGKTWLACALAQQDRTPGLQRPLHACPAPARGAARRARRWQLRAAPGAAVRIDLLAIDDLAIAPITAAERNDLLELLDDRVGTRSTLITSQLRSLHGTNGWTIRRWPMRSSIASCMPRTRLRSRANGCAAGRSRHERCAQPR